MESRNGPPGVVVAAVPLPRLRVHDGVPRDPRGRLRRDPVLRAEALRRGYGVKAATAASSLAVAAEEGITIISVVPEPWRRQTTLRARCTFSGCTPMQRRIGIATRTTTDALLDPIGEGRQAAKEVEGRRRHVAAEPGMPQIVESERQGQHPKGHHVEEKGSHKAEDSEDGGVPRVPLGQQRLHSLPLHRHVTKQRHRPRGHRPQSIVARPHHLRRPPRRKAVQLVRPHCAS